MNEYTIPEFENSFEFGSRDLVLFGSKSCPSCGIAEGVIKHVIKKRDDFNYSIVYITKETRQLVELEKLPTVKIYVKGKLVHETVKIRKETILWAMDRYTKPWTSVLTAIPNFLKFLISFVVHYFKTKETAAHPEIIKNRRIECQRCVYGGNGNEKPAMMCRECYCVIKAKTIPEVSYCPLGKW